MSRFSDGDPGYLRRVQYADGTRLGDRLRLHQRFSTNPYGWHRWVFDQLALEPGHRVLEAACGTGELWRMNADRVIDVSLALTDISAGMAAQTAAVAPPDARVAVADVQALPFVDRSFDVVICNHALYHVPDRTRAAAELCRVVRPGGRAVVGTNGRAHLGEVNDLRRRHIPGWSDDDTSETFGLENGADQLSVGFDEIELRRYADGLQVTEVEPLVAFVCSTPGGEDAPPAAIEALAAEVADTIARAGSFEVTKDAGLFVCRSH